jgi:sugar lactone lactonase YvrE
VARIFFHLSILFSGLLVLNAQAQSFYERYPFRTLTALPGGGDQIAIDGAKNIYSALGNSIVRISPSGEITTLAGAGGTEGSVDGAGSAARFKQPHGVAVDSTGNIYVADHGNQTIRKITPLGVVTTVAGSPGIAGDANGNGTAARFNGPNAVAIDPGNNVIVADTSNQLIRRITPTGDVTTLAGQSGVRGSADGSGTAAQFHSPLGVAVDAAGYTYVAEWNHTIRKISPTGVVTTVAGLAGTPGAADGTVPAARFSFPTNTAVDSEGNLFVTDLGNQTIRKITPAGVVTTLAGLTGVIGNADGIGSRVRFTNPDGIVSDLEGFIYVGDNHAIRIGGPNSISQLLNISTRGQVKTDNEVLIGGFIVRSPVATKVVVRALGPSLSGAGIPGALQDPTLELYDVNGKILAINDNWKGAFNAGQIIASGLAPTHDLESAVLITLDPEGSYTAVVRGKDGQPGIGLVEVYDLSASMDALLANISTRGLVGAGDDVLIGGFIVGGPNGLETGPCRIIVRALGPSLDQFAIGTPLPNPFLKIYDANGVLVRANDNWKDSQENEIRESGLPPANDLESAAIGALAAGNYTAVVSDTGSQSGIALVEVYNLQN